MKALGKGIKLLCIFIIPLVLFIIFYRMALGKTNYLPVIPVLHVFETWDFAGPINNLVDMIVHTFTDVVDFGFPWSEINDIVSFFNVFGTFLLNIFNVLILPIKLVVGLCQALISYIVMFYDFISLIMSY